MTERNQNPIIIADPGAGIVLSAALALAVDPLTVFHQPRRVMKFPVMPREVYCTPADLEAIEKAEAKRQRRAARLRQSMGK